MKELLDLIRAIINRLAVLEETMNMRINANDVSYISNDTIKNSGAIATTEDAICEVTEDMEQRISDIEDAICELTEG